MSGVVREDLFAEQADLGADQACLEATDENRAIVYALLSVGNRLAELAHELRRARRA